MVLLTVLGLYAYFQRGRKEVSDSHSAPGEPEDQSDDVPPVESNDGQMSSQDSSGPPQFFNISEERVPADPRVDDWIDIQTPVPDAPDPSDDVTQASGQLSSQDSSGPPQFFNISEERVPADPRVDDWIDETFSDFNRAMLKFNSIQTPVHVAPDTSVIPASENLAQDQRTIMDIRSCGYEMGVALGEGGFGTVYAATRLQDGLRVAVKIASNKNVKYARVGGYSRAIPLEVALQMFANGGPRVPHIIQLLDWQDEADRYLMVLERPMPSLTVDDFLTSYRGNKYEDLVCVIMQQTTLAAQACCQRGVFHRDIKLENLLINTDTFEVKLIDFGCGEFLNSTGYYTFSGTRKYCPPEYWTNGHYYGKPATVWSLGVLLFLMMCRSFPRRGDLEKINQNSWTKNGLSQECCDLIGCCLQVDPERRIELEKVGLHNWFKTRSYKDAPFFGPGRAGRRLLL